MSRFPVAESKGGATAPGFTSTPLSICLLAGYKGRIQQTKNGQNSLIVELGSPLRLSRFSDTLVTGNPLPLSLNVSSLVHVRPE